MAAIGKATKLMKDGIIAAKPLLERIQYYAKVELIPPKPSEFPAIRSGIAKLIQSAKTKRYRDLTVREAWLNTLVGIEVLCWFYVGECIGKRNIVGYNP